MAQAWESPLLPERVDSQLSPYAVTRKNPHFSKGAFGAFGRLPRLAEYRHLQNEGLYEK